MRRTNGSGSITHLQGKRRHPWRARRSVTMPDGSRRTVVVGDYRTKHEAEEALAALQGRTIGPLYSATLAEVYELWAARYTPNMTKTVANKYRRAYDLSAVLHGMRFRDLRAAHWETVIAAAPKRTHGHIIKLLASQLSTYAVKNEIIPYSYAETIEVPTYKPGVRQTFSETEIAKLWRSDGPGAQIALMLLYSGMRVNELLSLSVFQVDLKRRIITGGSKTEAGKDRSIPIAARVLPLWQRWCEGKTGRIFLRPDGQPIAYGNLRVMWTDEGIQHRPHDTRHTSATLMVEAGIDPAVVKEILGHKNYSFTVDTYTHIDEGKLLDGIDKI